MLITFRVIKLESRGALQMKDLSKLYLNISYKKKIWIDFGVGKRGYIFIKNSPFFDHRIN